MNFGNADYELADRLAERERLAGVARVRAQLGGKSGRLICDCGEPISEARRKAVPNTLKCVDCATFSERMKRRSA